MKSSALAFVAAGLCALAADGGSNPAVGDARQLPIGRAAITEAVDSQLDHLRGCYERVLNLNPSMAGRVVAHWTVAPSGAVKALRLENATHVDPALIPCLRYRLQRACFPSTATGGRVSFSFVFRPPNAADSGLTEGPDSMAIEALPPLGADIHKIVANGKRTAPERARDWINAVRRGDTVALKNGSGFPLTIVGYTADAHPGPEACGKGVVVQRLEDLESQLRCLLEDNFLREYIPRSGPDGIWLPDGDGKLAGRMWTANPTTLSKRLRQYRQQAQKLVRDHVLVNVVMTDNNGVTNSALLALQEDEKAGFVVDAVYLDELFED